MRDVYQKQNGFILLSILFLLLIILLTYGNAVTHLNYSFSLNHDDWNQNRLLFRAQNLLKKLEGHLPIIKQSCLMMKLPAELLKNKDEEWLNGNTCSAKLNDIRYYYAVEALGKDNCCLINNSHDVADFYRISLFAIASKNSKVLLQSTFVTQIEADTTCQNQPRYVKLGRQMWREI